MATDYKKALDAVKRATRAHDGGDSDYVYYSKELIDEIPVIKCALLISDKLMQKPSALMCERGTAYFPPKIRDHGKTAAVFKAMRDELLKEIQEIK